MTQRILEWLLIALKAYWVPPRQHVPYRSARRNMKGSSDKALQMSGERQSS